MQRAYGERSESRNLAAVPQSNVRITNLVSKVARIIVARCNRPEEKALLVRDVDQIGRAPLVVDRNHSR